MDNKCKDCIFAVFFRKPEIKERTKKTGGRWGGLFVANIQEAIDEDLYDHALANHNMKVSCHRYPAVVTKDKKDFCGEYRPVESLGEPPEAL